MCDTQFLDYNHKITLRTYSGYPTPPSEDSPGSAYVSSPTYISDGSCSPNDFMPSRYIVRPDLTMNNEASVTVPDTEGAPYLNMIEQPTDKFRFRYKSEMSGTHGSLCGETSDRTRKMTFPTVELCNYVGTAIVRCSIWQYNETRDDFSPHAHRLVKKNQGKEEMDDPHDLLVNKDNNYKATFHSMGIIHTAKKNIVTELKKKKTKLMLEDIARKGRSELNLKEESEIKRLAEEECRSINLNVVCLRFDAFHVDNGIYFPLCPPIYSHVINNLKSALTGELKIVRMDHVTSPANGGREIFLLVERVTKKNIKVRFYEVDDEDNTTWEDYGRFNDLDVHHQFAIVLKTPPYKKTDISQQVKVFMELVRPTDNARSESKQFTYIPISSSGAPGAKRCRPNGFDSNDYDTSSIGSEGIPTTLNMMNPSLEDLNFQDINSEDLIPMDINSDEFNKIYNIYGEDYEKAGLSNSSNLSIDFSGAQSKPSNANQASFSSSVRRYDMSKGDENRALRVYKELKQLVKTKPGRSTIVSYLRHHLKKENEDFNAFHIAVMINRTEIIDFLTRLIYVTGEYDLVNLESTRGTVLHLATLCNNLKLIKVLLTSCKADISRRDSEHNTPLHLAAAHDSTGNLLHALMDAENAVKIINDGNKSGDTALHVAVKNKNMAAVKVLCKLGADIDYRHPSNGFTPLRFAVESNDAEMVKFILYNTNVNPRVRDFTENDPLQVVFYNESTSQEVRDLVNKYMEENNIPHEAINIKVEPDERDLSEDEMIIMEEQVKVEPLPDLLLDLDKLYENVSTFTEDCLEKVSKELDCSGKWQDLAVLLDIEHLLRMQTFDEKSSPTKQLMNFVVGSNGASLKEIRDFLEVLDEIRAVEAMDLMVQTQHGRG